MFILLLVFWRQMTEWSQVAWCASLGRVDKEGSARLDIKILRINTLRSGCAKSVLSKLIDVRISLLSEHD